MRKSRCASTRCWPATPARRFDPALASLRQPFAALFPYSSYRLVQGEQRRVVWRREAEFLLPGGRYLVVIPRGYKDDRVLAQRDADAGTRPLVNTDAGAEEPRRRSWSPARATKKAC